MRKVFADGLVTLRTFGEDRVPAGTKKNAKQCAEPTSAGFLTQAECRILAHSSDLHEIEAKAADLTGISYRLSIIRDP